MINKNDCLILLKDLQENGIETNDLVKELYTTNNIAKVVKFINTNRQLDLSAFYERLRKNYNNKKSNLYINIVKSDEDDFNTDKVLSTLSALQLQIFLYSQNLDEDSKEMFLRHSRAGEICKVLDRYLQTYDLRSPLRLLQLVKADLKVLESC
jgi:hypothetical protein